MPALIEMTMFGWEVWYDDGWNVWLDDGYNVWVDNKITVDVSQGGYRGARFWEPKVLAFTPPRYQLEHYSGGYCKLGFGDITLALDTFDEAGIWPPPENCECTVHYTMASAAGEQFITTSTGVCIMASGVPISVSEPTGASATSEGGFVWELFRGTLHRQKLSRDGVVYQFYERAFDTMLLTEATDYDGNTVPLPVAFGAVAHQQPVRLADAGGGNQRYSAGGLTGTKHTDWHVYDDGVDVCSSATAISANVFEYTVAPVGEITISGIGTPTTLIETFSWACGAAYLNLSLNSDLAGVYVPAHWASSQEVMVSFLDRIAANARHLWYVSGETLYLVAMDEDNGTDLVWTEDDFRPSTVTYAAPTALVKTTWTDRTAVEETIGKYIKEIPQEVSVAASHPYGSEESVDCFQSTIAAVTTTLTDILAYRVAPRWETAIPLEEVFPLPGQKITAIDESMGQAINIVIHARDIEYDFDNAEIRISGEGTVS